MSRRIAVEGSQGAKSGRGASGAAFQPMGNALPAAQRPRSGVWQQSVPQAVSMHGDRQDSD